MADDVLAPGDVELVDLPGGKKGIRGLTPDGKVIAFDDLTNFMQEAKAKMDAANKARSNESSEAEERAYVEYAEKYLGLRKEAIL